MGFIRILPDQNELPASSSQSSTSSQHLPRSTHSRTPRLYPSRFDSQSNVRASTIPHLRVRLTVERLRLRRANSSTSTQAPRRLQQPHVRLTVERAPPRRDTPHVQLTVERPSKRCQHLHVRLTVERLQLINERLRAAPHVRLTVERAPPRRGTLRVERLLVSRSTQRPASSTRLQPRRNASPLKHPPRSTDSRTPNVHEAKTCRSSPSRSTHSRTRTTSTRHPPRSTDSRTLQHFALQRRQVSRSRTSRLKVELHQVKYRLSKPEDQDIFVDFLIKIVDFLGFPLWKL